MFNFDFGFELELLLRIALSVVCGFIIGHERENRNKFAGIRTHIIVSLGACLGMIISKYGFADTPHYDAARVAAQIVSGVGFLGTGVIFVKDDTISGLTTSAGIWTMAIIGMSFGAGLYFVGIVVCMVMATVQSMLYVGGVFFSAAATHTLVVQANNLTVIDEIKQHVGYKKIKYSNVKQLGGESKLTINMRFLSDDEDEVIRISEMLEKNPDVEKFYIL
ncbi:MAG: MgtC/SapB family protein [Peptoniphilus sp.]|uniref:MgtC/SapB family protein n=1 Tax=Peptoniphilus sp. TaxID=1971214 RepID=UPI002A74CF44|nr:MgtC/SapB family protein [Peptoniphilus sp.]MDY2986409.1 MgtC/SapB family protein [Peptoniphilus sp.]